MMTNANTTSTSRSLLSLSPGVYGNDQETFVLTDKGILYLIQSPDFPGGRWFERTIDLPGNVIPLSIHSAADVTISPVEAFDLTIIKTNKDNNRTFIRAEDGSFWIDSDSLNDEIQVAPLLLYPADTYASWCREGSASYND